jgi:predicted ArsR family transcriptional regulator
MQLDLLNPPRARSTDPATSHAAARRVSEFGHAHAALIVSALGLRPMTMHEIAKATGLDGHAVARRLPELERSGHARPTDNLRRSPSGRMCRVWELA